MKESFPNPEQLEKDEKERKKKEFIALAEGLASQEKFPFPGIDPDVYARCKVEEEQYPEYSIPIDELIQRFEKEGFRVVFGDVENNQDVFIVPAGGHDVGSFYVGKDRLFPRHLKISGDMDEILKKLIEA